MTDFEKQISFIMELDKIKKITRQTYLSDGSRKENDAEHSWHLALMAFVLADYANEPIDVLKTMKMVLLHDVIEIDAGDTYAYDTEGNKTKRERELKAADRIFGLLPEAQQKEYRGLWDEFEAMETPESKFANMLDKVQPLFLNDASGGISWEEHGALRLKQYNQMHLFHTVVNVRHDLRFVPSQIYNLHHTHDIQPLLIP